MPVYDYDCERCGGFSARRSMQEAGQPLPCPTCQTRARRVISAPYLATVSKHVRLAQARNERSAHEPRVVRRDATGREVAQ
jgi:putative FmdB family regulatory protein